MDAEAAKDDGDDDPLAVSPETGEEEKSILGEEVEEMGGDAREGMLTDKEDGDDNEEEERERTAVLAVPSIDDEEKPNATDRRFQR